MPAQTPEPPGLALNLALAMVASSDAPLLLLDNAFTVVAASRSFCRAFGVDPEAAAGSPIFALGAGEWDSPKLRGLLKVTLSGATEVEAYEMALEIGRRGRRMLVLHAHRLDYAGADQVRLLLTITDVTDARAAEKLKDNILREKAILLQEVQHRVANSLQIIASVLLQSARKVQSEETRSHLHDAHNRVMSIAAVQRQLAASRLGSVALRPYLNDLCQSLGASMIDDPKAMVLEAHVDDSAVDADISVSLGLIVTELVINALKHAFPGGRNGHILVDYHSRGPNWTLSVQDDGVGMPKDALSAKPGLGTSIVEALAKQLKARHDIVDAHPGTLVRIAHAQIAAVVAAVPEAA